MTSTHYLPVSSSAFREIAQERLHAICLLRADDVHVGDQLVLREQTAQAGDAPVYTGAWLMRKVTAELESDGVLPTHAVYSLNRGVDNERATVVVKRQLGLAEAQGVTPERFFRHQERRERARRQLVRRNAERVAAVRARGVTASGRESGA